MNEVFVLANIWGNSAGLAQPCLSQTTEKVTVAGEARHLQPGESHSFSKSVLEILVFIDINWLAFLEE